jgi:hypothetical protein
VPVQGCTLPLPYSRAIPLLPLWAVRPVQNLSACTRVLFTFIFTKESNKTQTPGTFCTVMNPVLLCRNCLSNSIIEHGTKEFRWIIDVHNLKLSRYQIVCLLYNTCRSSASPVVHTRYRGTRIESRNSEQCYACLGVYICQWGSSR